MSTGAYITPSTFFDYYEFYSIPLPILFWWIPTFLISQTSLFMME